MNDLIALSNLVDQVSYPEKVIPSKSYKLLGVRWYAKGLFIKDEPKGADIKAKILFRVEKGNFLYNRLFAWKGSFSVVGEEFDGCYVSNEFPQFKSKGDSRISTFLNYFFSQEFIWNQIERKSSGVASISRNRYKEKDFLATLIPNFQERKIKEVVHRLTKAEELYGSLIEQLMLKEEKIHQLRQAILQEAVQGKLAKQNEDDEPADKLLQRIKTEKQKLIAAGKLRKEKDLPPITENEIPFELPKGWVWCRLGGLVNKSEAGKSLVCDKRQAEFPEWGIIKVSAVSWGRFDENENKVLPRNVQPRIEYRIQKGDYLISRANTDELIGKSVIVDDIKSNLLLSDKSVRIIFSEFAIKEYINLYNNSLIARDYYKEVATGTSDSMKNISREQMYTLPIPLPPLSEQQRIVAKVEQLMQIINELEKQVDQSRQQASQLLQAILKEAFTPKGKEYKTNEMITMAAEK